ncbi:MAG: dTMP kinase [Bacillota bacterium]
MVDKEEYILCSKKGILIVNEGISGSGKSECVKMMFQYLSDKGYKTGVIEWNSNSVIRNIVDRINRMNLLTSNIYCILQYVSFFFDYVIKIIPLLKQNYIVIADRYIYTALTRDAANGAGRMLGRILHGFFRKPDLLFFHSVTPEVCLERIKCRGKVLFHTNNRILKNNTIKNKDLYYLKKLDREYMKLISCLQNRGETNIVVVSNDSSNLMGYVEGYLDKKITSKRVNTVNSIGVMTNGKKAAKGCYTEKY